MKRIINFSMLAIMVFAMASCKKNDIGGDATIAAFPVHGSTSIFGATVYVKFKATEQPANPTTDYDLKIVGESAEEHVHIEGLRAGKYYLYAEGFDSTAAVIVKGGLAVEIKWADRALEQDVIIDVTP